MELRQLRYFATIAKTGNFTRAASELGISQSTLSQQVLKLEEELRASLFDRTSRGTRLTAAGKSLLPRAIEVLRQISEAELETKQQAGDGSGVLLLGSVPTILPHWLPPVIREFRAAHPNIAVRVAEDLPVVLLDRLRDGTLDIAVLSLPIEAKEFSAKEVLQEPLYVAAPNSHPIGRQRIAELRQIANSPLAVLKPGFPFREVVLRLYAQNRLQPIIGVETLSFASMLSIVASGTSVAIVPRMAVSRHAGCKFIPLNTKLTVGSVGVVWSKKHSLTRAQTVFIEHVTQETMMAGE